MAAKVFESIGKFGLALAVAGGVVNSALYNVDAGHRAVIFDRFRGVQDIVVGEGTHFLIPWVQKPIIFDCRSRPRNVPVITGSKDLQNVNITLRILSGRLLASFPASSPASERTMTSACCPLSLQRSSSRWWLALMLENSSPRENWFPDR